MYSTSICETLRRDILLISSSLATEGTWTEASHAWVFVVKSGELRGSSLFFNNLPLMIVLDDTLKASHAPTNMDYMR